MDLGNAVARSNMQSDVRELLARADKLERSARGKEAAPLIRAATDLNKKLDGKIELDAKHILARVAQYLHKARGAALPASYVAEGNGDEMAAAVLKATVDVHSTVGSAIAGVVVGPLIESMVPSSLLFRHKPTPYQLPIGENSVYMPRLALNANSAAWVGEGKMIPVAAGTTGGVSFTVQKVGVIVPATNDLLQKSVFAPLVTEAMLKAIGQAADARFFADSTQTDAPAGIFSAGSGQLVTGSASIGAAGVVADLTALVAAAVNAGVPLANASFVMNPLTMGKLQGAEAGGNLPFAAMTQFAGIPFESSVGMPVGRLALIAWDAIVALTQGLPRVTLGKSATLHMETAPVTDISVATPTRSMFQTDSTAIKVLFPVGWNSLNAAAAQVILNVGWD